MDAETEEIEITPHGAIQLCIFELCRERRDRQGKADPDSILPYINKQIAALELAQKQLQHYRKLRDALAVLQEVD